MKMRGTLQILFLALVVLSGCSKSGERKYDESSKTLVVSQISGETRSSKTTNAWSLINQTQVNVSVCLENQASRQSVGRHHWYVDGDSFHFSAKSVESGCLNWVETVTFDPAAQPTYVPFERTIRDRTGAFNAVKVRFLVNPWSGQVGDEPVVIDPSRMRPARQVELKAAMRALMGADKSFGLFVPSVTHQLDGRNRTLDVSFSPELLTRDMNDQEVAIPIEFGRAKVKIQLFYKGDRESSINIHDLIVLPNVKFANSIVDLKALPLTGFKQINKTGKGSFYLALEVIPIEASAGLKPFARVFNIGDVSQLAASTTQIQDSSTVANMPKPAPPTVAGPEAARSGQKTNSNPQSALDIGFQLGTVTSVGLNGPKQEDSIYRHVEISLSVGVTGSAFNEDLDGAKFRITSVDSSRVYEPVTVKDGHLQWSDSIYHNYYAKMKDFRRTINFTRLDKNGKPVGASVSAVLDLMPWVRFFVVVLDEAARSTANPRYNVNGRNPQLRLESPCFSQGDARYSIDPSSLNLNMDMILNMQFSAKIRRFDEPIYGMNSFDGPGLRAGYYRLSLLVYNLDLPNALEEPIAVSQRVVQHVGGALATQMGMMVRDLSLNRLRNFIVAKIDLLDPNTLKLANGQSITGLEAYKKNLEVIGGQVLNDSELALDFPVHIFPAIINGDNCSTVNGEQNYLNTKIKELTEQIRQQKLDVANVARLRLLKEKQMAEHPVTQSEQQGWRDTAQRWGLQPLELNGPQDARALGYDQPVEPQTLEAALECAYQVESQDELRPAKCLYQKHQPIWELCQALANHWSETLLAQKEKYTDENHRRFSRAEAVGNVFFSSCYNERKTQNVLKVRKYTHLYQLEGADRAEFLGGYRSDLTLRDHFFIGTDFGTEFMNETLMSLGVTLFEAKVKGGLFNDKTKGIQQSLLKSLGGLGSRIQNPAVLEFLQTFEAAATGMIQKMDVKGVTPAISVKGGKSQASMRWLFNYQIPYNMTGISTSTNLTLENLDVKLKALRYRTCYSIEADISPDEWEGLLVEDDYVHGYKPRFYVCLPAKSERKEMVERYFFVYNDPPVGGEIDSARAANRWFLSFRGERDYGVFLINLRSQFENIYRGQNGTPEPILTAIDNIRSSRLLNMPMAPGVVSGLMPLPENYESLYKVEGYLPKIMRWLSEAMNPFETYGAPTKRDQNDPASRDWENESGVKPVSNGGEQPAKSWWSSWWPF